jgi:hypothetical protein
MRSAPRWSTALLVLLLLALLTPPAGAQPLGLGQVLNRVTGGMLWGSIGFRDARRSEQLTLTDTHPIVRGGFAAFMGTFGAQPDTTVTLDSVKTTVQWTSRTAPAPGVTRTDTIRAVKTTHSHYTLPGRDGRIALAVGYDYSGNYNVDLHSQSRGALTSTFPVGGLSGSVFFGPFPLRYGPRSFRWYSAVTGHVVQLSGVTGLSDGTFVRFDTERTVAPELSLFLSWRWRRGIHSLVGMSVQHIRWSALRYHSATDAPLEPAVLTRLPDGLRLTSVHVVLGVSFDTNEVQVR